jgi:hypothetical protein
MRRLYLLLIIGCICSVAEARDWSRRRPRRYMPSQPAMVCCVNKHSICKATACVCPTYPAAVNGNSVFYYSEVCNPSPGCDVFDVVYYWDDPLEWPLTCDPSGSHGYCLACNELFAVKKRTSPSPFPGLSRKIDEDSRLEDVLPMTVPEPGGGASSPRAGVKDSTSILVTFRVDDRCDDDANGTGESVTAKLFIATVNPQAAGATSAHSTEERFVFIGFEVDPLTLEGDENPRPCQARCAFRKKKDTGSTTVTADSRYVQRVEFAMGSFLVLLAER